MKIKDNKAYRETYQKWMDKQAEINTTEEKLTNLEKEATELRQQLENYKQQKT
ncbi:hypothetical protein [Microcoleus asticus]|uniref:Uncharacterized protein n=1 Tax=Microcoleus asticus IPMA8 TaxID=2563858 RepID=A0ABX2CXS9_9CYAN|nr:hypothetical protein [Microcoleus asticus]NQE35202.1 hypothetical protein [Microcoleus asticus IPMA8]